MARARPDFEVSNHGTIFLLTPLTKPGQQWVDEHIPDDAQMLGVSVAVEHRYISPIVDGIEGDGLTVRHG